MLLYFRSHSVYPGISLLRALLTVVAALLAITALFPAPATPTITKGRPEPGAEIYS